MRRGVTLIGIALFAATLAAAAARAAGSPATTTIALTTTTTTTTTTGTTTTGTTTTTPAPSYRTLASSGLPQSCVGAGVAAISEPGRAAVTLGTPASRLGPSAYPRTNPILAVDSAAASGSTCRTDRVTLSGVSLFDGAVTATRVAARDGAGTIAGLEVGGSPVAATAGETVALGDWGLLMAGASAGRLSAPLTIRLLRSRDSLRAGTMIFLAFAAARRPAAETKTKPAQTTRAVVHRGARHHARKRKHVPQPLKVTPTLGFTISHYVFPVSGGASFIDTYGANRNDIYDGWHHGDDLFAPLGTPLVAVARGTLTLVGWNQLGGWRLWLTDANGNSFYYAHLSGYARWILHHPHVKAGEVIGFLGRTGDAFTTTPHLHFEIHPHQLTRLGYDGAVDPTSYLEKWRVEKVPASEIPQPARLQAPRGTPGQEAAVVWRQLLAARHLLPDGEPAVAVAAMALRRSFPPSSGSVPGLAPPRRIAAVSAAAQIAPPSSAGPWPLAALALTLAASVLGGLLSARRRRRRPLTP